ncbi:MAG: HDOD domain-containing protein [Exilibacterium sp.]
MTGFFNRIGRLIKGSGTQRKLAPTAPGGSVVAVRPRCLDPGESERGFYLSLFEAHSHRSGTGLEQTAQPLSVPQRLVVDVVRKNLAETGTKTLVVPRLPSVIPRLLQSLRDQDASVRDFVGIINKDPAMSAAVLKLANSAYFNPISHRDTSIERAVVKLGIEGLRSVLSAAVLLPVIQCRTPYFGRFGFKLWQHCLCCAVTCELIAKKRGLEPFKAYILGLTHDIGKIALFSELGRQFQLNAMDDKPGRNAFIPLLMEQSARLSSRIARTWELPAEVCEALSEQENINQNTALMVSPYGQLLYHANLVCESYARVNVGELEKRIALKLLDEFSVPDNIYSLLEQLPLEL